MGANMEKYFRQLDTALGGSVRPTMAAIPVPGRDEL